jgi:hypothetical protein
MNPPQLQDQPPDIFTIAAWITVISGVVSITKNLFQTSEESRNSSFIRLVADAVLWVVEFVCVGIAALVIAALWTLAVYVLSVYNQLGLLSVPIVELRSVFILVLLVTTTSAWLGFIFDKKELAALVIAFLLWFALLVFSKPSGEIQHANQLGGVAIRSFLFALLTGAPAISSGHALFQWLREP